MVFSGVLVAVFWAGLLVAKALHLSRPAKVF
jgi:hypothetical protein